MTAVRWHGWFVLLPILVGLAAFAVDLAVRCILAIWRERRRKPEPSADWCAVCLRDLPRGKVWEVREDERPFVGDDPSEVGATYLAMTFCREHAPRGAVRT